MDAPPVGEWLRQALDLTASLIPSEAGSLLIDDPSQKPDSPLTFVAAFGPNAAHLIGERVPSGRGLAGHVLRSGEMVNSHDASADPRFFAELDRVMAFETRNLLAAPVSLEDEPCGVLELVNRIDAPGFGERDEVLLKHLAAHISRSILNAVDVLKQNHLVLHDHLTGVRNMRGADAELDAAVRRAKRSQGDVAVLFADVDHLKPVNDSLGHRAGSEALRRVAAVLQGGLGKHGTVHRFGGDEFLVVYPQCDVGAVEGLAKHLRFVMPRETEGAVPGAGKLPPITVSIGIATYLTALRHDARSRMSVRQRLIVAADRALYRAKNAGRNRVERATPADDPA